MVNCTYLKYVIITFIFGLKRPKFKQLNLLRDIGCFCQINIGCFYL